MTVTLARRLGKHPLNRQFEVFKERKQRLVHGDRFQIPRSNLCLKEVRNKIYFFWLLTFSLGVLQLEKENYQHVILLIFKRIHLSIVLFKTNFDFDLHNILEIKGILVSFDCSLVSWFFLGHIIGQFRHEIILSCSIERRLKFFNQCGIFT